MRRPIYQKDKFTAAQDEKFKAWIRTLKSCVSNSDRGIVCAHVRRVSQGAGMGIKPRLCAVPLTNEEHNLQHQKGELEVLRRSWFGKDYTEQQAMDWFEETAMIYRARFLEITSRKA